MTSLGFDEAFAAYERVRHRLPRMPAVAEEPKSLPDLSALADSFDVFLLDGFGVLNIGDEAIPGAAERVAALHAAGKHVLVVTNAASRPATGLAAKYARLGYAFPPARIVSNRAVAIDALASRPERRWGVMSLADDPLDDLPNGLSPAQLADDPESYQRAEGFLLLGSGDWSEERQARLVAALREAPRPVIVGNPDIVAPRETWLSAEPGWYAHRLADAAGVDPVFCGKPFATIFETARERTGGCWSPEHVLMVGDSLHTDILGARAAGIASALVSGYGFLSGRPCREAIIETGIVPDFIIQRP